MVETEKEKTDRQLTELLNELRVVLPGAQVLLAFLLTAPFQARFAHTTHFERTVLFAGALLTAAGVLLLMAPSVYHRVRWNEGGKRDVIYVGHRLFLTGAACLALGMLCAFYLVGDFLFGPTVAVAPVLALLALVIGIWLVLPLKRGQDRRVRRME